MQALQTFAHKHADVGDVLLSLCFSPKDSTLSVAVLKTSNLSQSLVSSEGALTTSSFITPLGGRGGGRSPPFELV